jgi:hypothetical protein
MFNLKEMFYFKLKCHHAMELVSVFNNVIVFVMKIMIPLQKNVGVVIVIIHILLEEIERQTFIVKRNVPINVN